jgi:hypothetical protein
VLKLILSGLWVCVITLASSYAATWWKAGHSSPAPVHEEVTAGGIEYRKTKVINVPMIAEGDVQGYIMAQFVFTTDAGALKKLTMQPEVFIQDEAFRSLYADPKLDFRHLEKYDITALTKTLVQRVNARLEMSVVKDVLVQEFNYVSKEDMRK